MRRTERGVWTNETSSALRSFRKCIECFLCQDVCHVLREHHYHDRFIGPRFFVHAAQLEMHPLDTVDRSDDLKDQHGLGYCNITKCCTKVCPEHITITDNAIIPLKERVVDRAYDPDHEDPSGADWEEVARTGPEWPGGPMFELKPLSRRGGRGGAQEGGALPSTQRAVRSRKHLS